jgi:hypothetical protein
MGIRDRDYMKRPSDDAGQPRGRHEYGADDLPEYSKAEQIAQLILTKYRKVLLIGGILLAVLIVGALIVVRFSGGSH